MRYDFDTIIERRSTFASRWDLAEGEIPMSMADMEIGVKAASPGSETMSLPDWN